MQEQQSQFYCSDCGFGVLPTDNFCQNCGEKLEDESTKSTSLVGNADIAEALDLIVKLIIFVLPLAILLVLGYDPNY